MKRSSSGCATISSRMRVHRNSKGGSSKILEECDPPQHHTMTPNTSSIIAIDGPAASGKSTLGLRLAQALNYLFFDTGVMYRAITWLVLDRGIDVFDEAAVTALAEKMPIDVAPASV